MSTLSIDGIDIPTFRVKRSHKKSRNGCMTCKRRRVKCDETRPGCTVCRRRGLDCVYGEPAANEKPAPVTPESTDGGPSPLSRTESTESSPSSLTPPAPIEALASLETELVQHYLAHTVKSFIAPSIQPPTIWETVIPALAYQSRPVRNGMLTMAALCLHNHTVPEQPLYYLDVAEYYGEQFVRESSQNLRDLKAGDMDPNLACARLLDVLSLGFFRVHQHYNSVTILDRAAWTWLHMVRGAWIVHMHYIQSGGAVNDMLANELDPETSLSFVPDQDAILQPYTQHGQFPLIQSTHHERFAALRGVLERSSILDEEQAEATLSAINILEDVTSQVCTGTVKALMRFLCRWPARLDKVFVDMLVGGNHFALAIHAHWLMLVMLAEDSWWVGDMGRLGIREIVSICEAEASLHVEQGLVMWPRRMLDEAEAGRDLDTYGFVPGS